MSADPWADLRGWAGPLAGRGMSGPHLRHRVAALLAAHDDAEARNDEILNAHQDPPTAVEFVAWARPLLDAVVLYDRVLSELETAKSTAWCADEAQKGEPIGQVDYQGHIRDLDELIADVKALRLVRGSDAAAPEPLSSEPTPERPRRERPVTRGLDRTGPTPPPMSRHEPARSAMDPFTAGVAERLADPSPEAAAPGEET